MCLADLNSKTDMERKKTESISYLKEPNFVTLTNKEYVDITKFGEKTFRQESSLQNQQFSAKEPVWFKSFLQKNQFQDESSFLNLGYSKDKEILNTLMSTDLQKSFWTNYPNRYKFVSYQIQVSDIVKVTNRETYSLLEFLGDIGGLYEFLYLFGAFFAASFGKMNFKALLVNVLYTWD